MTEQRAVCLARAMGRCERCGGSLTGWDAWSLHHRRARGMGGTRRASTESVANLVVLCGSGTTGCHGWVESNRDQARELGWLLRQQQEPEEEPVPLWAAAGRPVLLDACGGWAEP